MRFYDLRGRLVYKNVTRHLIDWDGKSLSKPQKAVKDFLRPYWSKHIVYEELPLVGTRLRLDFLNATTQIAIEVQGSQHNEFNKFFHKNRMNYFFSIKRDVKKAEWAKLNGFTLIEVEESDIPLLSLQYFKDKFGVYI